MPSMSERAIRARALRSGYFVCKSRTRQSIDNFGEYKLMEAAHNIPVLGFRFDASLEQIAAYIDEPGGE